MIHAHEILKLIGSNERKFTKATLEDAVNESFGVDAKFTNCSGNVYNYDEIFQFFINRNKLQINEDSSLMLQRQNICS